jgi:hypothetical protein
MRTGEDKSLGLACPEIEMGFRCEEIPADGVAVRCPWRVRRHENERTQAEDDARGRDKEEGADPTRYHTTVGAHRLGLQARSAFVNVT